MVALSRMNDALLQHHSLRDSRSSPLGGLRQSRGLFYLYIPDFIRHNCSRNSGHIGILANRALRLQSRFIFMLNEYLWHTGWVFEEVTRPRKILWGCQITSTFMEIRRTGGLHLASYSNQMLFLFFLPSLSLYPPICLCLSLSIIWIWIYIFYSIQSKLVFTIIISFF